MLLNSMNLDLNNFLHLNKNDKTVFISQRIGFNTENVESLAMLLSEIGFNSDNEQTKAYLEKALQLYEICDDKDKVYQTKDVTI